MLSLIILVFGIPLRFLKLCWYFLVQTHGSLREDVEILYTNQYYLLKDRQIEVLGGIYYLNCFSLLKIIKEAKAANPSITDQQLFNMMWDLKQAYLNFQSYESANKAMVKMILSTAKDKKEDTIYTYHYAYIEQKNSIHQTSNTDCLLREFQFKAPPLPSLILPTAKNPGTIVTQEGVFSVKQLNNKYIYVPKYELYSITMHFGIFNIEKDYYTYLSEKYKVFSEIVQQNLENPSNIIKDKTNLEITNRLVSELGSNNYMASFTGAKTRDIIREIQNFKSHSDF